MFKTYALCVLALLCLIRTTSYSQSADSIAGKTLSFPSRLLGKLQSRTAGIDRQLTQRTERYLQKMQRREEKLSRKLYAVDSNAAKQLFAGSAQQYASLSKRIQTDTGTRGMPLNGSYKPYVDSLQGMLGFLQKNPGLLSGGPANLQSAETQFQALRAKMADADEIRTFVQQRKQQIGQYIGQHANLQGLLGKQYNGLNQDVYYYSQQLGQYKDMWDHPDQLEQKALNLLNRLPAFQTFMKSNSQLAGLFNLPANYNPALALTGLQTKGQVAQQIQNQVSAAGPDGAAALQSNLQSAESQLDGYKDNLSKLGDGNGDMDMPDFKPNDQKTKTFWKRLEYGTNFQTTHNNYYFPTVTDLGLSLGYRLGHSNVAGIGASYKIGWGNGIQHIALSSQGVGLRSFLEIKIKDSWSAAGGFEANYTTPFTSFQDIRQIERWTQSGLIGISKTVSMKSRVFKKTKLQLLWDFLSYQAVPKTQPILFRVGYQF
jgi:hypothetical protein